MNVASAERIAFRQLLKYEHDMDCAEYERSGTVINFSFNDEACSICRGAMDVYKEPKTWNSDDIKELDEQLKFNHELMFYFRDRHLFVCNGCGWWRSNERYMLYPSQQQSHSPYDYCPGIEKLDISNGNIAVDDLIFHLTKKWDDRKIISASAAESLVSSLLKEHLGCEVFSATTKTNTPDGGVDLYVCHDGGKILSAVQVKRRVNKDVEGVAEVRNFIGALAIENISKGIFVTTATRYTKKALEVPEKLKFSACARLELELVDGRQLFDLLQNLPRTAPLILPEDISAQDIWLDIENNEITTRKILYGY